MKHFFTLAPPLVGAAALVDANSRLCASQLRPGWDAVLGDDVLADMQYFFLLSQSANGGSALVAP